MTDTLSENNVNLFTLETFAASNFKAAKKAKGNAKKLGKVKVLLQWQKGSLKGGLLTNAPKDAAKLFAQIQAYMGDGKSKEIDAMTHAVNILDRTIKDVSPDLRDELYCQLVKQLTCNPSAESTYKGWNLMSFFVQYFPPSQNLVEPVKKFFQVFLDMEDDDKLPDFAKFCLRWLPKTYELGSRGRVPTLAELKDQLDAPFKAAVFGVSLEEVMEAQHELDPHATLPLVLTTLCDRVVELDGYQTEGIFRVPGDVAQLTALKIQIEHGDYSCQGLVDAHVPGSLLKLWMRELAKPIIPTALYDDAIVSAKADDWEKSVILAEKLEDLNRRVALYVVKYLRDMAVPENVPVTKMSTTNLAMVFAPNFLRCPSEDPSVIFSTQKHQQTFVKHLIEHWSPPDLASVGKQKSKKDKEKGKGKEREKGNRTHRKEKEEKETEEKIEGDVAVEVAVENGVHKRKKSTRRSKSRSSRGNKTGAIVKKQELAPPATIVRRKSRRKHKKRRKSHHAKKEDKSENSEEVQPEEIPAVEQREVDEVSENTSEEVRRSEREEEEKESEEKEGEPSVESSSDTSDDQVEEEAAIVSPESESNSEESEEVDKQEDGDEENVKEQQEKEGSDESDSAGEEATGEGSGSSVETDGENSALEEEEEPKEEEEEELATTDDGVSSSSGYQDIPSEAPGDSEASESSDKASSTEQSAMSSTQSDFDDEEESSSFQ
eukprot:TRINITY_DN3216_c0_g1_i2.p1 TRINITY_DN3216_c0_g1~~TRINITY_DN3216_c0_g1_i2.p1  ORF type:complete len:716 (-),score=240.87 TRINITY_DN3216_c0_g1_i2:139-2286(-)